MLNQKLLYIYPPDTQKSEKHRLAKRIFKGIQHNPNCSECQCCGRKIGMQNFDKDCCYSINELAFLGPGVPLFFCYLKNCIILLLVLIIVFVGFCIYSNITSSYCSQSTSTCQYNIFNTLSILNKINKSDYLSIQNYILVGFTLVSVFLFQWFRFNFRQVEEECDDIIDSPSDYAIILRRLPPNIEQKDIERMIDQRRGFLTNQQKEATQNLKIDHIVLSFSLSQYTKIKQQNICAFKEKIEQQKIQEFKPKPLPSFKQTASIAIVIFAKQESKQLFIYKPNLIQRLLQCLCTPCTPLSDYKVKDMPISIQRSPQPDDIIWQNTKISLSGAICRKTLYNVLGVLILLLGGASQYGLALLQNKISDPLGIQLMSVALTLLITIFNFLILQFLIFTSQKERNQTLTQYNTVLTVKISFFQFLNTGIFVILGNFLADVQNFTLQDGMPFEIYLVMTMNALSPNISLWILNYFEISGKIFRWMIKTNKTVATQLQSNQCWQKPIPQIPYKYAYILKTIWLTAFYTPFAPVVVVISMLGLVLNYLIQRHLYGHVYSMPNMLSSMVNDGAIQLMEYFPLILSLGQFIIYLYFMNYDISLIPLNWQIPIYASICISGLNLLLPMDTINKCLIHLPIDSMKFPPYQKVEHKFQVTYQMTNPAYTCQRKRKRDVFLFNHIFGGEGKNVALQMTNLFGLNSDGDNSAKNINSPLLPQKKIASNKNQGEVNPFANLFGGINNSFAQDQEKSGRKKLLPQNINQNQSFSNQGIHKEDLVPGQQAKNNQFNKLSSLGKLGKMTNKNSPLSQNHLKYVVHNSVKKQSQKLMDNQIKGQIKKGNAQKVQQIEREVKMQNQNINQKQGQKMQRNQQELKNKQQSYHPKQKISNQKKIKGNQSNAINLAFNQNATNRNFTNENAGNYIIGNQVNYVNGNQLNNRNGNQVNYVNGNQLNNTNGNQVNYAKGNQVSFVNGIQLNQTNVNTNQRAFENVNHQNSGISETNYTAGKEYRQSYQNNNNQINMIQNKRFIKQAKGQQFRQSQIYNPKSNLGTNQMPNFQGISGNHHFKGFYSKQDKSKQTPFSNFFK